MVIYGEREKVSVILKKRIKFYIFGYIIGLMGPFVAQLKQKGHMSFFPINLLVILCAIGIGTAAYYGVTKMPVFAGTIRGLKYIIPIIIIVIVSTMIEVYLKKNYGIDIKPYIGF
jgi:hypothetical protein